MSRQAVSSCPTPDIATGCWSRILPFLGKSRRDHTAHNSNSDFDLETTKQDDRDHKKCDLHWYGRDGGEESSAEYDSLGLPEERLPEYTVGNDLPSGVVQVIEQRLKALSPDLRQLSLDIWNHPETGFKEKYAHDRLTEFMTAHGFSVTPHYLGLSTAWRAEYTHRSLAKSRSTRDPLRVIGINSEMDALPNIGHGCGHNLIAMSGAAVAVAIKAALNKCDIPGTIVLLGTPAEETRGGKVILHERGAYEGMDACLMCHPTSGPHNFTALYPGVARQPIDVEFFGHSAHAAAAPWEAQNALDAAFVAYASISALRQQIKPDHRVHGIISGRNWVTNVIPDYAKMRYYVRAPTWAELSMLRERVTACFQAAALATGCKLEVKEGTGYFEVRNNHVLGEEYFHIVGNRYAMRTDSGKATAYSTDFGNITYALPALHPAYSIPTEPNGSNHTEQFAQSARKSEAHEATLKVALGLAVVGFRILYDAEFTSRVREDFVRSKAGAAVAGVS